MSTCDSSKHTNHLCNLHTTGLSKEDPDRYAHLVRDPQFVCKSCGRVAASKENLCDPVMLGTWEE